MTFKNSSGTTTTTVAYAYDSSDLRIEKHVDSDGNGTVDSTERYIIDAGQVILQLDTSNAVCHRTDEKEGMAR